MWKCSRSLNVPRNWNADIVCEMLSLWCVSLLRTWRPSSSMFTADGITISETSQMDEEAFRYCYCMCFGFNGIVSKLKKFSQVGPLQTAESWTGTSSPHLLYIFTWIWCRVVPFVNPFPLRITLSESGRTLYCSVDIHNTAVTTTNSLKIKQTNFVSKIILLSFTQWY